MYPKYFGLREPGFSITPDPHYLFLTDQHREALAHLLYGTEDGGGFVLLTGEVGTGKTTVCRALLEQIPEHVDVALVVNPALNERELLQTVCREFGVPWSDQEASVADLVEALNRYLLAAHARGHKPVLVIDEAQNLKPEVLEQIRLLTNLETDKYKLLQIFLIGQPELREVLGRRELRQLAQRITARYHLGPLRRSETLAYIRHRLEVAGGDGALFTPRAMRRIHGISGGVPRLVNILCDRALLGAFVTQRRRVGRHIVDRAARELRGEPGIRAAAMGRRMAAGGAALLLAGLAIWSLLRFDYPIARTPAPVAPAQAAREAPRERSAAERPLPATRTEPGVGRVRHDPLPAEWLPENTELDLSLLPTDRTTAMTRLLARWGLAYASETDGDPCDFAAAGGLICRKGMGDWERLRGFDRPAMIRLGTTQGIDAYTVLIGLGPDAALLDLGYTRTRVFLDQLEPYWEGEFLILWRAPPGGAPIIGPGAAPDSIVWLRGTLARVPGLVVADPGSGVFDPDLTAGVRAFQTRYGLDPDGIAGPETLIRLNTASGSPDIQRLALEN